MTNESKLFSKNAQPVILLCKQKSTQNEVKKWKKRLKGCENFQIDQNGIVYSGKTFFNGMARWKRPLCVTDGQVLTRWSILELYYIGYCFVFAIRADAVTRQPELPGMQFSKEERELVYYIADGLRRPKDYCEKSLCIQNPEKRSIKENLKQVTEVTDLKLISEMMLSSPLLPEFCTLAILTNLRPWLPPAMRPNYLTNFLTNVRNHSSQLEYLRQLLQALNFTSEPEQPLLIEVSVENQKNLQMWESLGNRMALIHCGHKIASILCRKAEQLALARSAGQLAEGLPAQALIDSRSVLLSSCVNNVELPSCLTKIASEQQEVLRRALAQILEHPKREANRLLSIYQKKMHAPNAYRLNPADAWMRSAQEIFLHYYPSCGNFFQDAGERKRQQEMQRSKQLEEAVSLILTPDRFTEEIGKWPESNEEAKKLLDETQEVVALNHKGKLCFSHDSLRRLTSRVGLADVMYEPFIERLKEIGAIKDRTQSHHFRSSPNGRFITISPEKCNNFSITGISTEIGEDNYEERY